MKIPPPHLDDRAKAAVKGTAPRGLDYVNLPPHYRIALQHAGRPVWQIDGTVVQAADRPVSIVVKTITASMRQAGDVIKAGLVFESPQKLAKRDLAFPSHDKIHRSRS